MPKRRQPTTFAGGSRWGRALIELVDPSKTSPAAHHHVIARALHQLSKDLIMEVAATVEPVIYAPGTMIIRQGEAGDCFYIILDGECEITCQRPGGGEILLDHGKPGEYFGEAALVHAAPRNASVRAGRRPVRLLPVSTALFDRLVKGSPNFRQELERVTEARSHHLFSGGEA